MKTLAGFLLISFLLAACSAANLPTAIIAVHSETPKAPTPTITSTLEPRLTTLPLTQEPVRPNYDLDVQFDYGGHSLLVDETIYYANNSSDALGEINLVIDAQRQADFELLGLKSESGPEVKGTQLADGILTVSLASPLTPGTQMELNIEYTLQLQQKLDVLAWSQSQTNFIDWYPYVAPYVSGDWLICAPALVGEHGVFESSDFSVHIQVNNAPTSLQLAAAAPASKDGATWNYTLNAARRFVWSASGRYQVLQTKQADIPIRIYFFEEQRDAAEASLEIAKQAVEIYSNLFGPYPYPSLSIVEGLFFDGMESDGLFFLPQDYFTEYSYNRKNYLTALTAHEIAHNWWFGQVGNDQATEPWLDEAPSIYSELLYYESAYPNLVDWWWDYRINRFEPTGWINSTVYDFTEFAPYVHAVYMRGAQFLQEARDAMGDQAFFDFLREYSQQGTGRIMTRPDFMGLLQAHSSVDLQGIVSNYFH